MTSPPGPALALLLLGAWRRLVDDAVAELAERGISDLRPAHEFAMRAIASGADNASELGRRMSISKQAAAKVIESLLERGYVRREDDPRDGRRKRVTVTDEGHAVMDAGAAVFDELRARLEEQVGARRLAELERTLAEVVGEAPVRLDAPGWVAQSG